METESCPDEVAGRVRLHRVKITIVYLFALALTLQCRKIAVPIVLAQRFFIIGVAFPLWFMPRSTT